MKRFINIKTTMRSETSKESMEKLDEIFKEYIPKNYVQYYNPKFFYPFDEDSPYISQLLYFAQDHFIDCEIRPQVHFTKGELDKMPFYEMRLPDPLELEAHTPLYYGNQYRGRCPICGYGGELVGDFMIDRKLMKKYKIVSTEGHYFLSNEVRHLFEENGITGIKYLGSVKDYKTREMPAFNLFACSNVLPSVSPTTILTKEGFPCKHCGFDIVHYSHPLEYEKSKLDNAMDFNFTYETLSNDRSQLLVVSSKVKQICKENKIFARFDPILLLD